jgi:hypothetical protein
MRLYASRSIQRPLLQTDESHAAGKHSVLKPSGLSAEKGFSKPQEETGVEKTTI